jgi:hypothetical protein
MSVVFPEPAIPKVISKQFLAMKEQKLFLFTDHILVTPITRTLVASGPCSPSTAFGGAASAIARATGSINE